MENVGREIATQLSLSLCTPAIMCIHQPCKSWCVCARVASARAHVHTRRIGAFAHRVAYYARRGQKEREKGSVGGRVRERERRRGELSDGRYLTEDQHRIGFRRWLGTSCEHLASLHSNLNGILYLYALVWIIESLDRIKLLFLHKMEEIIGKERIES